MLLNERVINLSAMKLVDNIIFGAPYVVNNTMINHFQINEGTQLIAVIEIDIVNDETCSLDVDPFKYAKELGIHKFLGQSSLLSYKEYGERVKKNYDQMKETQTEKEKAQNEYEQMNSKIHQI